MYICDFVIADGSGVKNRSLNYVFLSGFHNNSVSFDDADCLFQPERVHCSTLNYVLTSITTKQLLWIDTIYVNGVLSSDDEKNEKMIPTAQTTPRKVNIICLKYCVYDRNLRIYADAFQRVLVIQVEGFLFHNSTLSLLNVHMVFKNVKFVESLITDLEHTEKQFRQIEIHFEQTIFEGQSWEKVSCSIRIDKVFIASVFVQSSEFIFVSTQMSAGNLFFGSRNTSYVDSQVNLNNIMLSVITFENVHFTGVSSHHRDKSVLNIFGIKMQVDFVQCVFENTSGLAISKNDSMLVNSWIEITLECCLFQQNMKSKSGGAISIHYFVAAGYSKKQRNFLKVTNSTLIQNEAVRSGSVLSQGGALSIKSQANTDTCTTFLVKIESSTFTNNKASDGGGALFVSDKCINVFVKDSIFEVTDKVFDSPEGIFIFSHSDIAVESSIFSRELVYQSPPLIHLEMVSQNAVIRHLNIILQCHAWYKPTTEIKIIEMHPKTVKISCTSCQPSLYVPTDGHFLISMQPDQGTVVTKGIKTNLTELNCVPCPAGAKCPGNDFTQSPNFWGLKSDQRITMYQCPAQYCCSKDCVGYNQCAGHRTGILCGSCEKNYSLSMLSSNCVSADACNESWLWPLVILAVMLYVIWYTFKDDVFGVPTKLCQIRCKFFAKHQIGFDDTYLDRYFGIVAYFIQIKAVLLLPTSEDTGRLIDNIFTKIDSCIQLVVQFELTTLSKDTCSLQGMTTSDKIMFKFCFLVGVYLFWNLIFFSVCLSKYFHLNDDKYEKIRIKLISGLIEIIKYTYSGYSSLVFYSLTCTTVDGTQVWFYDGSVECYSQWQIFFLIFGLFCMIPYPFYICFGMKLLKQKAISQRSFLLGICLPFPTLIFWWFLSVRQKHSESQEHNKMKEDDTNVEEAIYNGFRGEYRESDEGTQYWEGVMILKRLLMSATILIPNALMQLLVCLALCLLYLVHHTAVKPFKSYIANHVETFSLTLLCSLAAINLLKASYLHTDVNPQGSQVKILQTLELIEILSVFLLVMFAVILETSSVLRNKTKQTVVLPGHDETVQSAVGLASHACASKDENQDPDSWSSIEMETVVEPLDQELATPARRKHIDKDDCEDGSSASQENK